MPALNTPVTETQVPTTTRTNETFYSGTRIQRVMTPCKECTYCKISTLVGPHTLYYIP